MSPVRAVVRDRRIDIAAPEEIPDGTPVDVRVLPADHSIGLSEAEWDDSATGAVNWMKWLETLQPITISEAESQQLAAECEQQKRWEHDQFDQHADQLRCNWE